MNTEINHATANEFIAITNNTISINLTSIEDSRTADIFTQELLTHIKTSLELNATKNDTSSDIIISERATSFINNDAIVFGAAITGGLGAIGGGAAVGSLLARLTSLFKISKSPASELQANIAKDLLLLGKEIGVDSMSIKITKGASIGIGGDITGFKAELTKNDDNTIELSVKY